MTATVVRDRATDPAPVIHIALASYAAEHHLPIDQLFIPRIEGARFEMWIRDTDIEHWYAAGARISEQTVRNVESLPHQVAIKALVELDLVLGTITVELNWLEAKTLTRRLQAVRS